MIELGSASNRTCQICLESEAMHFCKCTAPPTVFCMQCLYSHHTKYPRAYHQVLPIAALSNPKEYKRRNEALVKTTAELRSIVERMDQCASEFTEMMQNCINYLTEYRTQWLQQLQTDKEELVSVVETAIQEATMSLDQGVEPVSALGRAIWTLSAEELQGFSYTVSPPDLPTLCKSWAQYQNHLRAELQPKQPAEPIAEAKIRVKEEVPKAEEQGKPMAITIQTAGQKKDGRWYASVVTT